MNDEGVESQNDEGIATFVIRIRLERGGSGQRGPGWVAHVTNVLDQSERYFRDMKSLVRFIEMRLARLGVEPGSYDEVERGDEQSRPRPET